MDGMGLEYNLKQYISEVWHLFLKYRSGDLMVGKWSALYKVFRIFPVFIKA